MKSSSRWWIVLYVLAVVIVLGRVSNAISSDHFWRELIKIEPLGNTSSVAEWIGEMCEGFLEDYVVFIVVRRLIRESRNPGQPSPSIPTNDESVSTLSSPPPKVSPKLFNILFPFRSKYRELDLRRWWWHRLAIVLFVVALSAGFLMSAWIVVDDYSEKDSRLNSASSKYFDATQQTDQNVTPTASQALNQYEEQNKKINHDANVSLYWEVVFAFGFLACLSYILQSSYRAIIYVAYGSKRGSEPNAGA